MSSTDALAVTLAVLILWPLVVPLVIKALRIVTEQF